MTTAPGISVNFVTTSQQRNTRACMVCSIVQLQSRFVREGCPNCEEALAMQGSPEAVDECTSQMYEGLITLTDPATSWVARWQRLDNYVSGVYAVKVIGNLPDEARQRLEDAGVPYRP
ncbi:MAG: transcription elongation factor spt4 [Sarcosagium campestre]|nr:MAG: transcription elongation factor spt4 [Sarcosagium campestre]